MQFQIEEKSQGPISCLKVISSQELFKEALGDLYSDRYFMHHKEQFGKHLFIFEVKDQQKTWSLMKDNRELRTFTQSQQIKILLPASANQSIAEVETLNSEEQALLYERVLSEVLETNTDLVKMAFFQSKKEGFGKYSMKKRSGGRYKQTTCCKLGEIFQRWKQRTVAVFLKGVAYYNEKGQVREFLSFSHGFHFEFGRPSTGLQLGLTLYSNHRKLSIEALTLKDLIFFLYTLRSACNQSCYMSLNRFNSFAPIRYASSVRFFVDGCDYFDVLADSLQKSTKSILIMGWMISPQFLLRRENYKLTLDHLIKKASERGVIINMILYYQTCFLSNGSQYTKEKLEQYKNVKVLCHPCGKIPSLWSHHGKVVVIDEKEGFIGGLDICYGRYDSPSHELFPPASQFPGLEHSNIRKNDQWDVKSPGENNIPLNQCRLPWHDVAQSVKGDAVMDLTHHFYQMWNFIRYQNQIEPENSYAPSLFESDVRTAFSSTNMPESISSKGLFRNIEKGLSKIKQKGNKILEEVKNKVAPENAKKETDQARPSASSDYFGKYLQLVGTEINQIKTTHNRIAERQKTVSSGRTSGSNRSSQSSRKSGNRSQRYSIEDLKFIHEGIRMDSAKEDSIQKTHSFLLSGEKKVDFFALDIDQDYVSCLKKIQRQDTQPSSHIVEIESDEEAFDRTIVMNGEAEALKQGRDQCQVVRSAGNWSIGCHPTNTEFSIHIAYLQLISQAKHYIYIENQFFISSLANPIQVKNEVAQALYFRIRKAITSNERFVVYVVLPLLPGFSGDLQTEDCTLLRKQMQWQYSTICRGDNSLWQRLLSHTNDPSQYIKFLGLRNHGRLSPQSLPQTEIVYVHSKLMIIDDEIVICGSANINDRSLLGDRDSQVAVISRGEDFVQGKMNGECVLVSQVAQELRVKLWKEHFGFSQEELMDPLVQTTWDAIADRAASNTNAYRSIFGCYPDDQMTTNKQIKTIRTNSQLQLYDTQKEQIKGHVVDFPLHFLEDESLAGLVTEKEYYVPNECLT